MLSIAIQKSGRLSEETLDLLKKCGIDIPKGQSQLKAKSENFPLEVFFFRDDDIPQYVFDKVADIGIVGENVLYETEKKLEIVKKLGFGKCRLSMAIPKNNKYENLQDLKNLKIATSYPVLVENFSKENNLNLDIHEISGSVEIAPGIGLSDAIADLVSTGSTLISNGLKEVETILFSEAVLVKNNQLCDEKNAILNKLILRINAVQRALKYKYIMLNAPNHQLENIFKVLPGMKSPTVVSLATKGWSSIQSVVAEKDFWDVIEKLKDLQAEGILVMPIEKMID